jgi:FkbM family methyltransferase
MGSMRLSLPSVRAATRERGRRVADDILRRLPPRIGGSLLAGTALVGPFVFTARGWLRLLTLQKLGPGARARVAGPDGLVALGVREWGGHPLWVHTDGTDWETAHASLIGRYHRVPTELQDVRTILDLGANIGATVADLAAAYPQARVLGVELDADNVKLARRNIHRWGDRASILHGAVWTSDGEIRYGGERGAWAYRVLPAMDERTTATAIDTVPAFSLTTLLGMLGDGDVDYVKMDVEGTEQFLLEDGEGWAGRVRCLQVEVHLPYDLATCVRQLNRLGFRTVAEPGGIPSVTALRSR